MSENAPVSTTTEEPVSSKSPDFLRSPLTSLGAGVLVIVVLLSILGAGLGVDLVAKGQNIGALGVFAVTFLGLVLAFWRFGLEDRQASAAEQAAEAAVQQAGVAKKQLEVARKQAETASQQIKLTEKQIKGAQALEETAKRQVEIAERQAAAVADLAAATTLLAETAKKQAGTAEQQAGAAEKQAGAAEKQVVVAAEIAKAAASHAVAAGKHAAAARDLARIDDQSLTHDRYRRAAEMLGNRRVEAVRIGGVDLLGRLARERPKELHVQVMKLLTSFVRRPVPDQGDQTPAAFGRLRADVQAILDVIGTRDDRQKKYEREERFEVNLTGANLQGADLHDADLESVNLESVFLEGADVEGARLKDANLENATLATDGGRRVRGLSQEQLDSCSRETDGGPVGLNHLEPALTWTKIPK